MNDVAEQLAREITKEQLLRRMASYVRAEAKRKKVPEWSIVGHIFCEGSGVSAALWHNFITKEAK